MNLPDFQTRKIKFATLAIKSDHVMLNCVCSTTTKERMRNPGLSRYRRGNIVLEKSQFASHDLKAEIYHSGGIVWKYYHSSTLLFPLKWQLLNQLEILLDGYSSTGKGLLKSCKKRSYSQGV
jgi:hypothetical protein